jgi:host factor-I protein
MTDSRAFLPGKPLKSYNDQEEPPRFRVPMQAQERDRQMENKPAQNIQDSFLNTARKDKSQITIYLLSGVKLTGRIRSFDKYSVVLETNNQEQLIFKHAISTVVMAKGSHFDSRSHGSAAEGDSGTGKSEG